MNHSGCILVGSPFSNKEKNMFGSWGVRLNVWLLAFKGLIGPLQASVDSLRSEHVPCGKLFFSLLYRQEDKALVVSISRADNLPAKDFSGTSDPYVKVGEGVTRQ